MEDPCCVCSVGTSKYRCPSCRLRYCSLDCCKTHKERCVPEEALRSASLTGLPDMLPKRDELLEEDEESDAVPLQKLMQLGKSEELKDLLLNTHLRKLLVTIDQTKNKDDALKKFMQEPLFVEFSDKCLSLVNVEEKENFFPK